MAGPYEPNSPLINQQVESAITAPAPPNYATFAAGGTQSPEVHHHNNDEDDLAELTHIPVDHMNVRYSWQQRYTKKIMSYI